MSLNYIGGQSLGVSIPVALQAAAAATATATASLPNLQAQLTGNLALQANIALSPPSLEDLIAALRNIIAQILALLAVPFPPPVVVDVTAMVAAAAELTATIGALEAQLALAASIEGTLGASIHFYSYTGAAGGIVGSNLPPGVGASSDVLAALVLATTPEAKAALAVTFGIGI